MGMMQCDICGDNLMMDVSGEFAACEFCGLKHPRARLMKKVNMIDSQPVMPEPVIGFDEEPVAPVVEEPVAPVVEEPVAPVVEEPVAPVVEEPVAPVVEEPVAPVVEEPVAPVVEEPIAPVVEEPVAPVVEEPVAPVVEEPVTPVQAAPIIGDVIPGLDDLPMDEEPLTNTYDPFDDEDDVLTKELSHAEKQETEKKLQKKQALEEELREFEEIYENNKKAFFGEGLKSKNYADMKIKEIKEKLEELEQ